MYGPSLTDFSGICGPRRIRTFDHRIKSPLLYQAELAALVNTILKPIGSSNLTNLKITLGLCPG